MAEANKRALVTGASGGLGAAIAIALARDGYDLAVADLKVETLSETVMTIQKLGRKAEVVAIDLRSHASMEQGVATAAQAYGGLDVLVNNAGVALLKSALDVTPAEWDAVMSVNLTGTFFMSQYMGRHLIEQGRGGSIISLASTHGVVGLANRSTYGISKGAIIQMTKMLAIEWARHGIRVNAIAPGTVETPTRAAVFAKDPAMRDAMIQRIPLQRFAEVEEIAEAARYLASSGASYITGQVMLLDGGLTAQ